MKTVLAEAAQATSHDRQQAYGHPRLHFACTAAMVSAYLIRRGWTPPPGESGLLPADWPQIMELDKTSRQAGHLTATGLPHRDTLIDQAGYPRTCEMLSDPVPETGTIAPTTSTAEIIDEVLRDGLYIHCVAD